MYDNATSEKASLLQKKSDESPYLQIKEKELIGEGGESKEGTTLWGNRLLVVVCILLTELCERLTYYSVVANLVLYCTSTLELPSSGASTVTLVFSGKIKEHSTLKKTFITYASN